MGEKSPEQQITMNGVIIIDKPCGKTSHDMVGFVRRLTGIKKVGHTGTLDPEATGVLPVCIGKATKACEKLTCDKKAYRVKMMLGMTTDTLDIDGEILTEQPVNITVSDIEKTVSEFVGEIEQIPPMYSAIKVGGKKLYELARAGIETERQARKITIYDIEIEDIDLEKDLVTLLVDCSKGTYIRTLCDDIGRKLGCGAFVAELRRTKSGQFDESMAYTTEELEKLAKCGEFSEKLIPVDELFSEYEKITVTEREKGFIVNGVRTRKRGLCEGKTYRVYDEDGNFLCLSVCVEERLTLEKAFWD